MRGKGFESAFPIKSARITPAYAGKSQTGVAAKGNLQDHPRLCGEKPVLVFCILQPSGSPPPMRGKVKEWDTESQILGITPAYAGKSRTCWRKSRGTWDHPRLCGEKAASRYKPLKNRGSPPPMRGKVRRTPEFLHADRITPAYAGKSLPTPCSKTSFRDHPRLCGEKTSGTSTDHRDQGSPPPMRGKAFS